MRVLPCECRYTPVLVVWTKSEIDRLRSFFRSQETDSPVTIPDTWMFLEMSSLCQSLFYIAPAQVGRLCHTQTRTHTHTHTHTHTRTEGHQHRYGIGRGRTLCSKVCGLWSLFHIHYAPSRMQQQTYASMTWPCQEVSPSLVQRCTLPCYAAMCRRAGVQMSCSLQSGPSL